MGTLHYTVSINLHNITDSGCDEPRWGVRNTEQNSQVKILYLCFVLLRRSEHVQDLHPSFPSDRPVH